MLSNLFDMDNDTYAKTNMKTRIASEIISAKANAKFSAKVTHILAKRYWDSGDEWSQDDLLRSRAMNADLEAAIHLETVLKRIYNSEYGTLTDEEEKIIDDIAELYANIPLKKFGWVN